MEKAIFSQFYRLESPTPRCRLVSGKSSSWLTDGHHLLHVLRQPFLSVCVWKQRVLLIRTRIPLWGSHSHLDLITSPKAPPPNTIILDSICEWGEGNTIQFLRAGSTAIPRLLGEGVEKKHSVCMSESIGQKRNLLHWRMKVNQD